MTKIKKINEMTEDKPLNIYVVTHCEVSVANDNFVEGEYNRKYSNYTTDDLYSDSITGLLEKINNEFCSGHQFNINDWAYNPEYPGRVMLSVNGKITPRGRYVFEEPTDKDNEDFKNDKVEQYSFIIDVTIEKQSVVTPNEFRKLGIATV